MISTDQLKATNEQLRLEIDRLKEVVGEVPAGPVVPTDDTNDDPISMFGIKSVNGVPVSTEEDAARYTTPSPRSDLDPNNKHWADF